MARSSRRALRADQMFPLCASPRSSRAVPDSPSGAGGLPVLLLLHEDSWDGAAREELGKKNIERQKAGVGIGD